MTKQIEMTLREVIGRDSSAENEEDMFPPLTNAEILMYSESLGCRIFVRNDGKDTTFVGILMDESPDSFLVAYPCRVLTKDGEYLVSPLSLAPYQRLTKSCIHTVMFPFPPFDLQYYLYLSALQFVDKEVKDLVEEVIAAYEALGTVIKATPIALPPPGQKESLEDYLSKKHLLGEVILNGPASKN